MTYYTLRRRLLGLASATALLGSITAAYAYNQGLSLPTGASDETTANATTARLTFGHHFWDALALEPRDAWGRLRSNFQWQDEPHNERIQHWIEHYRSSPHNIAEITERARPWLAWIVEQVEARGLPGELALLPFIESSFDPTARSHRGAAGLWQMMPRTGDSLGLRRTRGYDGRLDVVASTRAALDYIELQAEQWYDGDLELSLAAYNAGAGTVNRARRAALSRGEAGDYWSLRLPRETMNYLPKLKALAAIVASPDEYQVALPDIEDAPAFAKIPVERPLAIAEAARLAGVPASEVAELNPGLTGGTAHPGQARVLLVPADHADVLMARLDRPGAPATRFDDGDHYVVQRGDSLSAIAARQGISVDEIRYANDLDGTIIHEGQVLSLPRRSLAAR